MGQVYKGHDDILDKNDIPLFLKIIFLTSEFEKEIDEGGFLQFLINKDEKICDLLGKYLMIIGSKQILEIFKNAREKYNSLVKYYNLYVIDDLIEKHDKLLSYYDWSEFYDKYDMCDENIEELIIKYYKSINK